GLRCNRRPCTQLIPAPASAIQDLAAAFPVFACAERVSTVGLNATFSAYLAIICLLLRTRRRNAGSTPTYQASSDPMGGSFPCASVHPAKSHPVAADEFRAARRESIYRRPSVERDHRCVRPFAEPTACASHF